MISFEILKFPWRPSRAYVLFYEIQRNGLFSSLLCGTFIKIIYQNMCSRQYFTSLYTSIHVFPGPTDMVPFSCLHEFKLTTLLFIRLRSSYIKVKCKINATFKTLFFLNDVIKVQQQYYCCLVYLKSVVSGRSSIKIVSSTVHRQTEIIASGEGYSVLDVFP